MLKWLLHAVCCSFLMLPALSLALDNPADFEIRFGVGSVRLSPRDQAAIGQLAGYLKANPRVKLTLSGHADTTGPEDFNIRLSHDRAAAVRDWLVNNEGIAKGRVGITWLDTSRPVASNATETGRASNRRVVVQFVADGPVLKSVSQTPRRAPATRRTVAKARPARVKASPRPVVKPSTVTGTQLKEIPLRFTGENSILTAESLQSLSGLAASLKDNPGQKILVQGVPHKIGGRSDLQQARRRVDDVRTRLIYGLKVPAEQILVKWFGSAADRPAGDDTVGVLLKLMGQK